MSTRLRLAYLRVLKRIGVKTFVARSATGHKYVCHIGDFLGEVPFYNHEAFCKELAFCAAWLSGLPKPIALDVGAHVGFFATQLAQMVAPAPQVYAFEPAPETFAKLMRTIERLGLESCIHPVAAALHDGSGPILLSYARW